MVIGGSYGSRSEDTLRYDDTRHPATFASHEREVRAQHVRGGGRVRNLHTRLSPVQEKTDHVSYVDISSITTTVLTQTLSFIAL